MTIAARRGRIWGAVGLALLFGAASAAEPEREEQTAAPRELRIVGSGNMAGFLERMARGFESEHAGVRIHVEATNSSAGPPALLNGRAQLASMSRPMNGDETLAFRAVHDRDAIATAVAIDALAVFVNSDNPLERITLSELDAIFSTSRKCGASAPITQWKQVGLDGNWGEREIGLYGHLPSAGTHDSFRRNALCGGGFRDGVREQPGKRSVILSLSEARYGIGYAARADLQSNVKALRIARSESDPYASIEAEDVYAGRYPLARELYLYRLPGDDPERDPLVHDFLAYALSQAGQVEVADSGFLPLAETRLAEELESLRGE